MLQKLAKCKNFKNIIGLGPDRVHKLALVKTQLTNSVAYETGGPGFESSYRQFILNNDLLSTGRRKQIGGKVGAKQLIFCKNVIPGEIL